MPETGAETLPTLALTGATVVVSLDPPLVEQGDLLVAGGRVASVGTAPPGTPRRDCSGTIVMPGNVCAHHHLYSALARGMPYRLAPPTNFLEILQRVWWRLDRALDESSIRASALSGALDAVLAGTTSIVDHHASPSFIPGSLDVIADALAEVGVRSVLCYEVSDRDGPAGAEEGVAENVRFAGLSRPLARGMIGAHASFTLSPGTLGAIVEACEATGKGVHVHVAEDGVDSADSLARFGFRVVERLESSGALAESSLLAHCVHVEGPEVALVSASGATVVCNPRSNMNNGVGFSPYGLPERRPVALGTDGIGGDMFAEAAAGFFRAREADLSCSPDWPLTRLAEGARLVGRNFGEPLLGTLSPGAPADIVVLEQAVPTPLDAGNFGGHFVFGFGAARVRDVYVAGDAVVSDCRLTRVDAQEVADLSRREAVRLWERMDEIPAHEFSPEEAWR
jgi:putative selenium metabolism protein SsnA